jgi:hypothetical protein
VHGRHSFIPTGAGAVHHFSKSKNGVELTLHHKVSAQPRLLSNSVAQELQDSGALPDICDVAIRDIQWPQTGWYT